jgi:lysylphosphatidylglycerol synthetase-like protein (DUF2156 family)
MSSLGFALLRLFVGLRRGLKDSEFRAILVLLLLAILGGTIFYATEEGWNWIDAAYVSVITLATLSDPRFVPNSTLGKIFTMVYVLGGIGLMLAFVTRLATVMISTEEKDKPPV